MAVEARHINPFPSQLMIEGNLTMMNRNNHEAGAAVISSYNPQFLPQQILPAANSVSHLPQGQYNQFLFSPANQINQPAMCGGESSLHGNTDSGLTACNDLSRKRLREDHQLQKIPISVPPPPQAAQYSSPLLDEDFLPLMLRQHQYDVETLISQHTKRIRLEIAEKQRQQTRSLASAMADAVAKKLREKEEQIARMGKINMALQERVKSLYVENQLWRDMAQTNEATANSLRTNLEQVLLHPPSEEKAPRAVEDDAESCCGSNDDDGGAAAGVDRRCRMCGERESCVLLLPCRHLCLCGVCGGGSQTVKACPVCNSGMNATLHVNMSSS